MSPIIVVGILVVGAQSAHLRPRRLFLHLVGIGSVQLDADRQQRRRDVQRIHLRHHVVAEVHPQVLVQRRGQREVQEDVRLLLRRQLVDATDIDGHQADRHLGNGAATDLDRARRDGGDEEDDHGQERSDEDRGAGVAAHGSSLCDELNSCNQERACSGMQY